MLRTFLRPGVLLAALACACSPFAARAHHLAGGPPQGLPIASVSHGELAVVARHRIAIASLAETQLRTDPTFRRLRNYAELQRFACLWGLVPGSLTDEDSPFNGCSHAYLSAYKALLVHMASSSAQPGPAHALAAQIDQEVKADPTAQALCGWSGEVFDTAAIVGPRWADVPRHPLSVATLIGSMLVVVGGSTMAKRGLSAWAMS